MKAQDDARRRLERLRARVVLHETILAGGNVLCSRCNAMKPASAFYNAVASRRCIECSRKSALASYYRKKALAQGSCNGQASRPQGEKPRGRQPNGE